MPIYPVTKKCEFIVRITKKLPPFSPPFCGPLEFGPGRLTREICVWPMCACKIPDPLRFAGVIREEVIAKQ